MAEHAATLVDDLLPQVPVRQWVLTLPYRLRYRLAWDHALCRAVLGVFARTLLAFYARPAQARGIPAGQTAWLRPPEAGSGVCPADGPGAAPAAARYRPTVSAR